MSCLSENQGDALILYNLDMINLSISLDKNSIDKSIIDKYGISQCILMENAAFNMSLIIKKHLKPSSRVIFLVGKGNNGADGLAAARILSSLVDNVIDLVFFCSSREIYSFLGSELGKSHFSTLRQMDLKNVNFRFAEYSLCLGDKDVVVDCIFGSGYRSGGRSFLPEGFLKDVSNSKALKISCDTPSLIDSEDGFVADLSLMMGSLSLADLNRDRTGKIKILPIGIPVSAYSKFQGDGIFLVDKRCALLNERRLFRVNKGSFGKACILGGRMFGAALISARAALYSGAGYSLICEKFAPSDLKDPEIIYSDVIDADVLALGMGLSFTDAEYVDLFDLLGSLEIKMLFDADILCRSELVEILERKDGVLTPHPKELVTLLRNMGEEVLAESISSNMGNVFNLHRLYLRVAGLFLERFKNSVLVIKDSVVFIAGNSKIFVNPYGRNNLAKAGSGDVLSGIIAGLIAQGHSLLDSSTCGSLLLSLSSVKAFKRYSSNGSSPQILLEMLRKIKRKDLRLLRI